MIHVRRHTRKTASGKTATVRAHEREGGDERPAPDWATPASAADLRETAARPDPAAGVFADDDEPAGDWWADEPEPAGEGFFRRLTREIREVHAEDKQMRDDVRSGRKEYGTDWRSGSRDPEYDPDDGMSPAFRAMVAQNSSLGGEKFERFRALRESGYDGPIDQDGNPVDDEPDVTTAEGRAAAGWASPELSHEEWTERMKQAGEESGCTVIGGAGYEPPASAWETARELGLIPPDSDEDG